MIIYPSVVTTSDGNGVGYTGIRVRGSDYTCECYHQRNSYNDSESHGTHGSTCLISFFVESLHCSVVWGTSTNGVPWRKPEYAYR
jgi:iron complex outermembrane receptor protein